MSGPEFDKEYWDKLDAEIPGWLSESEARFLVENVQGEKYVEIGVAYGKSLQVVKHHFPNMMILGIDLIDHGVHEKTGIATLLGDANENATQWPDNEIDTLFIDGDHTYKGCLSDFVHWYNKVKPGGNIILHDYMRDANHDGVTQAVNAIKTLLKDFKFIKSIACGTKP